MQVSERRVLRKLFVGLLLFVGTILIFFGTTLIVPENSAANEAEIQHHSRQALDHMLKGEHHNAHDKLTHIINHLDPNIPEVYYERGTTHIATDNINAALADYQKAKDLYTAKGDLESAALMQDIIDETRAQFGTSSQ
ncbi:MAG: hypothetical protein HXY43_07530 [Fischerella sp.]|jgi:tetratricopeptide (TPR) repeat protein|uniref:hypothetical protein n=1 Tax=Fischerella sp. TaxID=1191 RepID=UPI00185A5147|nr:hypothetical protein [Fischerella sp.]NWF59150.1 hypothetical protein [Fischerella sp.]